VPWLHGTLDPKIREFVYIAVDVSVTHQYLPGTHVHIERALEYGATPAEVLEVMQLASIMGIHSFEVTLPILEEELALFESEASRDKTR
jgi:alkylhydroperoxidase/carboxymuconolactone decarboxylase family protein YurZ